MRGPGGTDGRAGDRPGDSRSSMGGLNYVDQLFSNATNGATTEAPASTGEVDARVAAICAKVTALDTEITTLEYAVAPLPDVLAALAHHPVLWLLIGREGIDRPGGWG